MSSTSDNGIVRISGRLSVDETVGKLRNMFESKGVTLFAVIDHSGEAEKVGLAMPNTKLLIFGNPKAGTPLMLAAPSVAIDLPMKMLVAEDRDGKVWVLYNSAQFIADRHGVPAELAQALTAVEGLAAAAAG